MPTSHTLTSSPATVHWGYLDAKIPPQLIVIGYYVFCLAFGLLALITTSRFYKLVALVVMIILTLIGFALVARLRPPKED